MQNPSNPLVSVIVPAHNAEKTIRQTLKSALAQTYENIEIIIVDDGSTDDTANIIREVASGDRRVRIIQQANAGVAAARNAGILQSAGDFVSPLDADDLWHPSCVDKRMAVLLSGGNDMAAVYTSARIIDEDSRVIRSQPLFTFEGNIFGPLLCLNIVGNGSNLLMRKESVLAVGGYECELRAAGAEGCEDMLLQFRLASKYSFGCVPEYLVGYMRRPDNMSSDLVRMSDSAQRVFEKAEAIASASLKPLARRRAAESLFFMGYNIFKRGQVLNAIGAIARAHAIHIGCGFACCTQIIVSNLQSLRHKWRKQFDNSALRRFEEYDPKEGLHPTIGYMTRRRFAWLRANGLIDFRKLPVQSRSIVSRCD